MSRDSDGIITKREAEMGKTIAVLQVELGSLVRTVERLEREIKDIKELVSQLVIRSTGPHAVIPVNDTGSHAISVPINDNNSKKFVAAGGGGLGLGAIIYAIVEWVVRKGG